ncbi:expressed unknown protein [Seminavis robusta]|uniref:Uncharacterized protein n=1 Tax=Seminavis robusta TaxID=568900 RepID=A0A9N8EPX6_9STRA|nr:expressed unknown protein [Seminavis robusta]|eukprot:Sro1479_g276090.1 n/a (190) ;mRNA; f:16975-17544
MVATTSSSGANFRQITNNLFRRTSYASFPKDGGAKKAPRGSVKTPVIKKTRTTKVKTVRFAAAAKVTNRHQIVQSEDLPNAWIQRKDYAHIRMGILSSIQAITSVFSSNETSLDLSQHCLRGIETGISAELYKRRKLRIKSTLLGVLEQQRVQRAIGISDPLALRAISLQCSLGAQESARSVGQLDSKL